MLSNAVLTFYLLLFYLSCSNLLGHFLIRASIFVCAYIFRDIPPANALSAELSRAPLNTLACPIDRPKRAIRRRGRPEFDLLRFQRRLLPLPSPPSGHARTRQ